MVCVAFEQLDAASGEHSLHQPTRRRYGENSQRVICRGEVCLVTRRRGRSGALAQAPAIHGDCGRGSATCALSQVSNADMVNLGCRDGIAPNSRPGPSSGMHSAGFSRAS